MFLQYEYILGQELCSKMKIAYSNVSCLKQQITNEVDLVSKGNCVFLKKDSLLLPEFIKKGIKANPDLHIFKDSLPITYIKSEFEVNDKYLKNLGDIFEIENKKFIKFFEKFPRNKVYYTVSMKEVDNLLKNYYIEGFVQVSKSKALTWY